MIKLKDILSEADTDPKTVFGNIAFGDESDDEFYKKFVRLQGKTGSEKNTKIENQIFTLLSKWTGESTGNIANKLYNYESLFRAASKKFPTIFKPDTPNGTEMYRGLKYTSTKLISFLKKTSPKDWKRIKIGNGEYVKYSKPITYTPERQVQSWTTSKSVANNFGWTSVLISKQNNEYLFSQKSMNILSGGEDEKEVMHFGKEFSDDVYIALSMSFFKQYISK
jgi:hypothetical protein